MAERRRIVVGISGASGAAYGVRMLEALAQEPDVESHLVMSAGARRTIAFETGSDPDAVAQLADVAYDPADVGAAVASGSFPTAGMVIAPCSIRTLSGVATCHADTLLVRAADVTLKERRRLVLMVRETPLHLGHLRLMTQVTEAGGIVFPPVPALYAQQRSVDEIVSRSVGRALDLLGVETPLAARWTGLPGSARP